jgi:hypothetical protein
MLLLTRTSIGPAERQKCQTGAPILQLVASTKGIGRSAEVVE